MPGSRVLSQLMAYTRIYGRAMGEPGKPVEKKPLSLEVGQLMKKGQCWLKASVLTPPFRTS